MVEVQGDHTNGLTDSDCQALIVYNEKTLTRLPQNISNFFPNIQALVWTHGSITTLVAEDIEPMKKLVILVLGYNKIVTLSGALFKNMPELLLVEFNNNLIEYVDKNVLSSGKYLDSADFKENPCIDLTAMSTVQFKALKKEIPEKCSGVKQETTTTQKPPTNEL